MKCPHCGTVLESSQRAWQERMKAQGRCIRCGKRKADADGERLYCRGCRIKVADADRRRRARRRPDILR